MSAPPPQKPAISPASNTRWWLLGVAFLLLLFAAGWWEAKDKPLEKTPEEKYYSRLPLKGNLGGVPVDVPYHFVNVVMSYEGDPSFWKGKFHTRPRQSERTYDSKITGFIFDVRYPDMVGKSSSALDRDYENSIKANAPVTGWISVLIKSGSHYHKGGLHRIAEHWIGPYPYPSRRYTRMPDKVIGGEVMEAYMVLGNSPNTGEPYRYTEDDIFIVRDKHTGRVTDYFRCSAIDDVPRPPCRHQFELEPKMAARVSVGFPKQMLPKWKDMKAKVKNLVYSFEKKPQAPSHLSH